MTQQPTYLSQGVNYLGFLSQQLGDLVGKTTLAHELIQNADDAKDETGRLSANRVTFDFMDDALIVSNDAVFREIDFARIRDVASGSKRRESGEQTTGTFGVGFISVYQVTDRPEIHSAGRKWILRPDELEGERIAEWSDPSITSDKGTIFRLPWARKESELRDALNAPTVDKQYIDAFVEELRGSLPRAVLFLKKLERVELRRGGKLVSVVRRMASDNTIQIDQDGDAQNWRILEADFSVEAMRLKDRYKASIDRGRSHHVRVAVPFSLIEDGLLFATLPTEQSTRLPFHIDADFYPGSDRKAIEFGDEHDPRSEWNRAAIRAAASAVQCNLMPLLDMYKEDSLTFWDFLSWTYEVHQDHEDDTRLPLGAFWESLVPSLGGAPIVYTESGKWLAPNLTRIPTGPQEEDAVGAFEYLGIEIVHRSLWKNHRNLLTRRTVGVSRISAVDIYEHLKTSGYANTPLPAPSAKPDLLGLLWKGIAGVLANEQGSSRETAENLLQRCSLAPGLDGRLWPCRLAFRSDEHTRDLFAPLVPSSVTFLAQDGIPLLERLCPAFTVADVIRILQNADPQQLEDKWSSGDYDPVAMLHWFEQHKSELTDELRTQLVSLSIFPSVAHLHPLNELWLPGGFQDFLGEAGLLDTRLPGILTNFLLDLGVTQLTFEDYARSYVPQAFARDSTVDLGIRRKLLAILERHIGAIKDNGQVRNALSSAWIVECEDGEFRQPSRAYFRSDEISGVLGDQVSYALVPGQSELRQDLYMWLGVPSHPRIADMVRLIERATKASPTLESRATVVRALEALGLRWAELESLDQSTCLSLKTKPWLPEEANTSAWYEPHQLYATYNKTLFASQGKFLDVPPRTQQNIGGFLEWLGVSLSPRPFHVVRHLLTCSKLGVAPPSNVYYWLNDNASPSDLRELQGSACLWVQGRYLRPDQVFWGSQPFAGFRVQLDSGLRSYQSLLEGLGVREGPDFNDAIEVLKDLSEEVGKDTLDPDSERVVIQCWAMLSDALENRNIDAGSLNSRLRDVPCVPTKQGRLHPPSWMFLEDRPGLAEKFLHELEQNCIPRTERAWLAMQAAGVRLVSAVVRGDVEECENRYDDAKISERVSDRASLIRTILEGSDVSTQMEDGTSILDSMRFIRADKLTVRWTLRAFDREWKHATTESVYAHWDSEEHAVFFANRDDGTPPWSAIARELTLALAPGENPASISPGLKSVLEAGTAGDASTQLEELGIVAIRMFDGGPGQGPVADSLGSDSSGVNAGDQIVNAIPNIPGSSLMPGGSGGPRDSFARHFHGVQTISPSSASDNPVVLPVGGPTTAESAVVHTTRAGHIGRTEAHELRLVTRTELGPQGRALADEFQDMVIGDYGKRCQICSKTFVRTGGGLLVNVVHVVPPREDHRTNHFGDLLGLCGWHFNLLHYGEWALVDPDTDQPFEDLDGFRGWERMRSFILDRVLETDEMGNPFVSLPVRFSNVYQDWESNPSMIREQIRYSIPHWEFLCALIRS